MKVNLSMKKLGRWLEFCRCLSSIQLQWYIYTSAVSPWDYAFIWSIEISSFSVVLNTQSKGTIEFCTEVTMNGKQHNTRHLTSTLIVEGLNGRNFLTPINLRDLMLTIPPPFMVPGLFGYNRLNYEKMK